MAMRDAGQQEALAFSPEAFILRASPRPGMIPAGSDTCLTSVRGKQWDDETRLACLFMW
jgi:hypothetical protein